jgi:hypothetical protein
MRDPRPAADRLVDAEQTAAALAERLAEALKLLRGLEAEGVLYDSETKVLRRLEAPADEADGVREVE